MAKRAPMKTTTRIWLLQALGGTLWPSFLIAAVASVVFFASIDPETLQVQTLPGLELSRMAGYTIGFFMFWGVGLTSSVLTLILARADSREQS